MRVDGGARLAARACRRRRSTPAAAARDRVRLRLQVGDHGVDFLARLADLGVQLLVQPALERLFALAQRVLALMHPRFGGFQRVALARGEAVLVLERAHVVIDLREVLGELRLAGAEVLARRGDHRRVQAEPRRRSRAPGCGPGCRRSTDRSARTSSARSRTRRWPRLRSSRRRSSADRSGWSRSPSRRGGGSDRRSRRRARRLRSDRCPTRLRRAGPAPASTRPRSIDAMLAMCAENVLRLASIDCSSPMSANSERNTGSREPCAAGIRRPACIIIASSPAVFSATVLPPVFGPVIEQDRRRRNRP